MTNFDIDVTGIASLRENIDDLEDDFESDAIYITESGASYSVFLEFGTEDMPPYPFFRPALREFRANPEAFLLDNTEYGGLAEIDDTDELVQAVAFALESQIKTNATAASGGRSPGVDADHPQVQTGNLRANIRARRIR